MRMLGDEEYELRHVELVKAPTPPDPLATMWALVWIVAVGGVIGCFGFYKLGGYNEALRQAQANLDREFACQASFERLEGASQRALEATLGALGWLQDANEYGETMRMRSVDQMAAR